MMKTLFTTLLAATSLSVFAGELDLPNGQKLPSGLVVREDAQGNREVFKTTLSTPVTNDDQAAAARAFATDTNKVQVASSNELDQTSSKEAWFYGYYPSFGFNYGYGYSYNYWYYGNSYCYNPCYSNWYGGYRYSYYWY